jgi:hypothetical protein
MRIGRCATTTSDTTGEPPRQRNGLPRRFGQRGLFLAGARGWFGRGRSGADGQGEILAGEMNAEEGHAAVFGARGVNGGLAFFAIELHDLCGNGGYRISGVDELQFGPRRRSGPLQIIVSARELRSVDVDGRIELHGAFTGIFRSSHSRRGDQQRHT